MMDNRLSDAAELFEACVKDGPAPDLAPVALVRGAWRDEAAVRVIGADERQHATAIRAFVPLLLAETSHLRLSFGGYLSPITRSLIWAATGESHEGVVDLGESLPAALFGFVSLVERGTGLEGHEDRLALVGLRKSIWASAGGVFSEWVRDNFEADEWCFGHWGPWGAAGRGSPSASMPACRHSLMCDAWRDGRLEEVAGMINAGLPDRASPDSKWFVAQAASSLRLECPESASRVAQSDWFLGTAQWAYWEPAWRLPAVEVVGRELRGVAPPALAGTAVERVEAHLAGEDLESAWAVLSFARKLVTEGDRAAVNSFERLRQLECKVLVEAGLGALVRGDCP